MNQINLKGVSKTFGTVHAVRDVSLEFTENKIYGLLGRNGAGKSTLLNLITGRIFPDSGQITVNGIPAMENDAALGNIYHMGERNLYPPKMRIREAFSWMEKLYPNFDMAYAQQLAEEFSLDQKKKMDTLSTGMDTMFRLTVALSSGAPYVFLDEPVSGLDAVHRDVFYKLLIRQIEQKPACYVISTHLIEEAAGLIEDVIIVKDGEVLINENTEQLLSRGCTLTGPADLVDAFIAGRNCIGCDQLGGMKSAYLLESINEVPTGLVLSKLNLQQLFVQLTKA